MSKCNLSEQVITMECSTLKSQKDYYLKTTSVPYLIAKMKKELHAQ